MEFYIATLPNGIRIIHKQINSPVAHFGVTIDVGSRDEQLSEHGIAHLIEHMVFKGTKRRKAYHIFSRLEDVGGEMNAFTTKEETCIHATFLSQYYSRAMELLSDVMFNSVFDKKEIVKELDVILDEINSYKDSPSEQIFDDFDAFVFGDHPIGRNILGDEKTLENLSRSKIISFINKNYSADKIVLSSVGNISFQKFQTLALKFFNNPITNNEGLKRTVPELFNPVTQVISRNTYQSHCLIGTRAYHYNHPNKLVLYMLNNLLGGPALNSRLNLAVREKNGLAYTVESSFQPFSDSGIFSIYLGTDKEMVDKALKVVKRELDNFKNKELGVLQLSKAKNQIKGYLTMSAENHESMMITMGKSMLVYNKVEGLQSIYDKIDNISSKQLMEVANEIFDWDSMSKLIFE